MSINDYFIEMVSELDLSGENTVSRAGIITWFKEHHPEVKKNTLNCQIILHSTNAHSRIYYGVKQKHDLLFQINREQFRKYNPENDPHPIYIEINGDLSLQKGVEESDYVGSKFSYERDLQQNQPVNNTFEMSYNNGILSKKFFLESPITNDFINWFIPFIKGEKNLKQIHYEYESLIEAINSYKWGKGEKKESFTETFNRFDNYRNIFKTSNDEQLRKICIEILKWGGVLASNENKINIRKSLKDFLFNINKIIDGDEIIIDDLNPNYINSGYTKIYSALNENFIMYDGRVGSALCFLIKNFLLEHDVKKLPVELIFGYGLGRGKKNRNPNDKSNTIRFIEITQNRNIHFVSNIKANWLLKGISEKVELPNLKSDSEKVFALQTALFVLGEKIPSVS